MLISWLCEKNICSDLENLENLEEGGENWIKDKKAKVNGKRDAENHFLGSCNLFLLLVTNHEPRIDQLNNVKCDMIILNQGEETEEKVDSNPCLQCCVRSSWHWRENFQVQHNLDHQGQEVHHHSSRHIFRWDQGRHHGDDDTDG